MMGERTAMQEALFYEFSIERQVPADHLPCSIDRFVELSGPVRGADALHRRATEPHSFAIARALLYLLCATVKSSHRRPHCFKPAIPKTGRRSRQGRASGSRVVE